MKSDPGDDRAWCLVRTEDGICHKSQAGSVEIHLEDHYIVFAGPPKRLRMCREHLDLIRSGWRIHARLSARWIPPRAT